MPASASGMCTTSERRMARPAGLESAMPGLEDRCIPLRFALFSAVLELMPIQRVVETC